MSTLETAHCWTVLDGLSKPAGQMPGGHQAAKALKGRADVHRMILSVTVSTAAEAQQATLPGSAKCSERIRIPAQESTGQKVGVRVLCARRTALAWDGRQLTSGSGCFRR